MTINDKIVYMYILFYYLLSYVIHRLLYIRVYYYARDSWDGNHDVFDDGDSYDDDDDDNNNIYL